jgi:hypothetical protein
MGRKNPYVFRIAARRNPYFRAPQGNDTLVHPLVEALAGCAAYNHRKSDPGGES